MAFIVAAPMKDIEYVKEQPQFLIRRSMEAFRSAPTSHIFRKGT
jgi:hypothetical protein